MHHPLSAHTALLICDMQNDFLHPAGAYARGGVSLDARPIIAAQQVAIRAVRAVGGVVIATRFTLVPGRDGAPMVAPHLKALRPFLRAGDFAVGSFGHDTLAELGPMDGTVDKIAFSAFYQTRLEWLLRKFEVHDVVIAGIVTNGGVASTARDAHVRDFGVTILADGCAAFSAAVHEAALAGLAPVATLARAATLVG
jgi:nicotinamidase-related amidase